MGRKGKWFKTVKNALNPKSKRRKEQKNKLSEKQKHSNSCSGPSGTVSQIPHIEEVKLACVENGEFHHSYTVSVSSSTAMTTQLIRKSREEVAAIKIQSVFRGYRARAETRTLRGLMRLKSLIESSAVNRQATNTLRCMQVLVRVRSRIRSGRMRKLEENEALQKQLLQKHVTELQNLQVEKEWNDSIQSKEQVEAKLLSKHEAAIRRERALAYAFSHQKTWRNSPRSVNPLFTDLNNLTWGWSWLERWMAAQSWESHTTADKDLNNENSYIKSASCGIAYVENNRVNARFHPNLEANSPTERQFESHSSTFQSFSTPSRKTSVAWAKTMKPSCTRKSLVPDDDCKSLASIRSDGSWRHSIRGPRTSSVRDGESPARSSALPSYMTFTESARAKSRLSYLPSPTMSRQNSYSLMVDASFDAENSISNGVSYLVV